jgi:esterase/lipase
LLLSIQESLAGQVIVAAPLELNGRVLPYTHWLSRAVPFTHHPSESELNAVIEAEQKRRGEPIHSRVHYPQWSTRAVYEMYRLAQDVKPYLSKVTIPTLLLYAQADQTAPLENMELLVQGLKSAVVEHHVLQEGAHIMFQDVGRDAAFAVVSDFIARCVESHIRD